MDLNPHLIQYEYLTVRTPDGDDLHRHTSKGATCTCGHWEAWSSAGPAELDPMHDLHLQHVKKKAEQANAYHVYRQLDRHTLRWRGTNLAMCEGCNWMLTGSDVTRANDAFLAHRERIKMEHPQ